MGYKYPEEERQRWISHSISQAEKALGAYIPGPIYDEDTLELEESVVALLSDLRHFCAVKELDFEKLDEQAKGHYEVEIKKSGEGE